MKFAIYAISGNEKANAKRFMEACNRTGWPVYVLAHCTDGTDEILKAHGATVDTTPIPDFTFDKGKNHALAMVPVERMEIDYCINLDLDERITSDAPEILSTIEPGVTQVRHLYKPDGEIDRVREDYRVHARHAYRWELPVHERLVPRDGVVEKIQAIEKVLITQWPSKERKHTWCERLLKAVEQCPNEPRLRMLCGRDLYFDQRYEDALLQFEKFVELVGLDYSDNTRFEVSYARTMIARCEKKCGNPIHELWELDMACREFSRRESFVELAHARLLREQYQEAFDMAQKAMTCTLGQYAAHNDPGAWSFKPYEIAMISAYNLHLQPLAVSFGFKALEAATAESDRRRISANLTQMGAL